MGSKLRPTRSWHFTAPRQVGGLREAGAEAGSSPAKDVTEAVWEIDLQDPAPPADLVVGTNVSAQPRPGRYPVVAKRHLIGFVSLETSKSMAKVREGKGGGVFVGVVVHLGADPISIRVRIWLEG